MKKLILIGLITWVLPNNTFAQASYGEIESRFTKNKLTKNDSLAFKKSAEEKVKQLMAYSKLYSAPGTGSKTKDIVAKKAEAMFRTNTQTGNVEVIQIDSLLIKLSSLIDSLDLEQPVPLKWIQVEGSFGRYEMENKSFQFDVILIKAAKNFGRNDEEIWQIYFCKPLFN